MKSNEMAGLGNWNTALYWEYDTRTGNRKNLDPKGTAWESPYSTFGRNPIWFSDRLGDSIKASPETNKIIQDGLNAVLGANNPIGYDAEKKALTIQNTIDKSKLTKTQQELLAHYTDLIVSQNDMVYVNVVDNNEKIIELGNRSLSDLAADGVTKPYRIRDAESGKVVGTILKVYISGNPTLIHNGHTTQQKPYHPALTSLHEIGGHAWIIVNRPGTVKDVENWQVTQFENRIRSEFNWNGMFINGTSQPHDGEHP